MVVSDKAVPNPPEAPPVASDISPTNFCAVTIPVNVASPCCLIVTPIPDPVPISRPVECNKESPIRIEDPGSVPIPAGATLVNAI